MSSYNFASDEINQICRFFKRCRVSGAYFYFVKFVAMSFESSICASLLQSSSFLNVCFLLDRAVVVVQLLAHRL